MPTKEHKYAIALHWTGNRGSGTSDYKAYGRDHEISAPLKAIMVPGSSDPHFRGDTSRYNPEELLVASLSACHLLSYLHLCAVNNVVVAAYEDDAVGVMTENNDGSGDFKEVTLRPRVTIVPGSDAGVAMELHEHASKLCFIARSVRFPVHHEPVILNG